MLTISELIAALDRAQQFAGDIPVILRAAESAAESIVTTLGIHLDPSTGGSSSVVHLEHAVPVPVVEPAPVQQITPGGAA